MRLKWKNHHPDFCVWTCQTKRTDTFLRVEFRGPGNVLSEVWTVTADNTHVRTIGEYRDVPTAKAAARRVAVERNWL